MRCSHRLDLNRFLNRCPPRIRSCSFLPRPHAAMGSPKQKEPAASHYHGRHRHRSRGSKDDTRKRKPDLITTEPAPAGPHTSAFSPQQQKAIFEHQLITRSQHSGAPKAYAHVPCKFFRQGACQAGDACPFSHSLDTTAADQTPCEYFRRGNCKFGARCANAHVVPAVPAVPAKPAFDHAAIDEADEDEFFPHDEQYYVPTDFAQLLLAPDDGGDVTRGHSRSSSTTSFASFASYANSSLGASLSSAASSYPSAASPLLHQQLAAWKPTFSPWSPAPPASHSSRYSASWVAGDLARLRIDEDEPLVFADPTRSTSLQDTQFLFDDLPDYNRL